MGEFELIRRFFASAACAQTDAILQYGIGDDCALLQLPVGEQLAVSSDSMVCGVHFPEQADPFLLAQRALACAASDLAAMGASPMGFTLALTLPCADEAWLEAFARGLQRMAERCQLRLIGGDTTRGPLNINVTVLGHVPPGQALKRSGARVGDYLCVGGYLGDAAGALPYVLGHEPDALAGLLDSYWQPQPQLALGQALRGRAHAAMDISDGLLADCGHIAKASQVALVVEQALLPLSPALLACCDVSQAREHALSGGDDYVLLFTLDEQALGLLREEGWSVHVIGRVEAGCGVRLEDEQGQVLTTLAQGYEHF